jgi:hypothetical protein
MFHVEQPRKGIFAKNTFSGKMQKFPENFFIDKILARARQ